MAYVCVSICFVILCYFQFQTNLDYFIYYVWCLPVKKIKCLACMISAFNTASKSFVAAFSVRPSTELLQLAAFISAFINISGTSVQVVCPQEGCQVYQQLNNPASICHTICQNLTGHICFRCLTFDMISCIWQGYFVSAWLTIFRLYVSCNKTVVSKLSL